MVGREIILQQDLAMRHPRSITLGAYQGDIASAPELSPEFNPRISQQDLDYLLAEAQDPSHVIRPWLIYAGAEAGNQEARDLFHAKPETVAFEGLFHATLRLWGIRTAIRYAGGGDTPSSPFSLKSQPSGVNLSVQVDGSHQKIVTAGTELEPESTCLKNIAYESDGITRDSDTSITINPIQSCPLRCGFCRRQYDQFDASRKGTTDTSVPKDRLINLKPKEIVGHLMSKYPTMDWASNMQVSFVTGSFANFDHMLEYVTSFGDSIKTATGGKFDPRNNPRQNMHVLTHLARTDEDFLALEAAGVKTVQDTIEIISDSRRASIMTKANPANKRIISKGEIPFDEALQSARVGVKTLGPNRYFPTVILGLDSAEDTTRGLASLREAGVTRLDSPIYSPFELGGLALYAMSAKELARTNIFTRQWFSRVSTTWNPENVCQPHPFPTLSLNPWLPDRIA